MKNLENFGVQELDSKEMRKTQGGWLGIALIGLAVIGGGILVGRSYARADTRCRRDPNCTPGGPASVGRRRSTSGAIARR